MCILLVLNFWIWSSPCFLYPWELFASFFWAAHIHQCVILVIFFLIFTQLTLTCLFKLLCLESFWTVSFPFCTLHNCMHLSSLLLHLNCPCPSSFVVSFFVIIFSVSQFNWFHLFFLFFVLYFSKLFLLDLNPSEMYALLALNLFELCTFLTCVLLNHLYQTSLFVSIHRFYLNLPNSIQLFFLRFSVLNSELYTFLVPASLRTVYPSWFESFCLEHSPCSCPSE